MSATLSWADIFIRVGLALLAGALVGLDRDEHAHPAGLRTTILIAVAAAVAMIQADWLTVHMVDIHNQIIRADIMRLPLGILDGVGFIGAGVILRRGELVRGVTSAATIWLTTVIGLCFGGGQLGLGAIATAIALATLWGMKYVEAAMVVGHRGRITLTFAGDGGDEETVLARLAAHGFTLRARQVEQVRDGAVRVVCSGRYRGAYPRWSSDLVRELARQPEISRVEWSDTD